MRRMALLAASTAILFVAASLPVFADSLAADGDTITTGQQTSLSLSATPGESKTLPVDLAIECQGKAHMNGSVVLSYDSRGSTAPSGGSMSATSTTIVRPSTWPADGDGCGSTSTTPPTRSLLTITAPTSPGSYTYKAQWTASEDDVTANGGHGGVTISLTVAPAASDTTPPVITATVTGTAGANNWYTSNVTVAWSVVDAESAVTPGSGCGVQAFTSETAGTLSTCSAASAGGSSSSSLPVKIDKTGPTAELSPAGTLGANGWYTSAVTITTAGGDAISGPVTCTVPQILVDETAGTVVQGTCTNAAGLSTDAAPLVIKLDKTGPTAALAVAAGTAGTNGWYTSDVTVRASGADTISTSVVCTPDAVLTNDTPGTPVSGSCTNAAGLTTPTSRLIVKIDKSDPSANLSVAEGTLGAGGWYTSAVTIRTSGADTVSEPLACTADQVQATDTAGATFNGSCTNDAGRTQAAAPLEVKVDTTKPTASLEVVSGTPGASGWYTSAVTVRVIGADPTSDVTCSSETVLSSETQGTVVTGSCRNGAGLETAAQPLTIKVDLSGPTANLAVTAGTQGAAGWYISPVTVATTGDDPISGPVNCTVDQYQDEETTATVFRGRCINAAGITTAAGEITVKVDLSAPSAKLSAAGQPGLNGWYTSDVTVTTEGIDDLSGIVYCTPSQPLTDETQGTPLTGSCTNGAGLESDPAELTVKIDKTAPQTNASVSGGTAGSNGWFTSDITVGFSGEDSISGIGSCTPNVHVSEETSGRSIGGSCANEAGLIGDAETLTIKLDKTPPTAELAVVSGAVGSNGWYTSDVTIRTSGDDSISGPVTCTEVEPLSNDTAGTEVKGSCTNDAGLTTPAQPITITLDKSDPNASLRIDGTLGDDGWYTSVVAVHASGGDNVSDPVVCEPTDQSQTADTQGVSFSSVCTNHAGRTQVAGPETIKVDRTPPTAELVVVSGTEGTNGWYTSAVKVRTEGADATSSVTCSEDQTFDEETATIEVIGSCRNGAGLVTEADPLTLRIDMTGPTAELAVTAGTAGANGWYTSDVSVGTSGEDAVSARVTCTGNQYQSDETAGENFYGYCTNAAGLMTQGGPFTVKVDKTGPTAALSATGTIGDNGWYTSDVTVQTSGGDSISGPVKCTADQSQTTDTTGAAFNGSCTNDAGLTTHAPVLTVKRDATAPVVAVTGLETTTEYVLGTSPNLGCNTQDATSGVATEATVSVTGGNALGAGTHVVTCGGARDNAGNVAADVVKNGYEVVYGWAGFLQPINDTAHQVNATTSVFKAGSTIPVKFQLKRADGTRLASPTAPRWIQPVKGGSMSSPVDESVFSASPTSGDTFRWDGTAQQYTYNWASPKTAAGSYWRIGVTLDDGQTYYVNIGLR